MQSKILFLIICGLAKNVFAQNGSHCIENPTGDITLNVRGIPGPAGSKGDMGSRGEPGPKGEQGTLNEEQYFSLYTSIRSDIMKAVRSELKLINNSLNELKEDKQNVKCGLSGNWRRIAYFDTTQGDSCPTGLRTVTNTTTNQTACGRRNFAHGCTSLSFPSGGNYTNVCGRVRAYQYYNTIGFYSYIYQRHRTVTSSYVDGISITQNNFRNHLWTYVAGRAETYYSVIWNNYDHTACPCARSTYQPSWIPTFLGNNYYCESGVGDGNRDGGYPKHKRIFWEDPLWDGSGCHARNNTCCERFGWFHSIVSPSTFNIEVRWCGYASVTTTDVPTDNLEIWVM